MASSSSEENINLNHSNTVWYHSVGLSCNFMDTFVVLGNICVALADVIAMLQHGNNICQSNTNVAQHTWQ